ncbi:unnamed protein product [Larinioides sclopetarius]|uniref:Uncharacterized protein n=1 Tax=Larinioides sclopetarius TaxID=280406 RepID=A0AAV1ZZH6_9ARAC
MNTIIILLIFGLSVVAAMDCGEEYCENSSCAQRSCAVNEKLYRKGNCDCCGQCIKLKKEGSPCKLHEVLDFRMAPEQLMFMNSDCDIGLSCRNNKCTKD